MSPHTDLVELRPEGLYCPAGDFHIDPWRPVPRAVITHAHGDHAREGSGVYHCQRDGAPLLACRLGAEAPLAPHAYGEAFTLGGARVSLHPAGHILGSAQVRIEAGGETWVVSGDYKRDPDPTCPPFEPQRCDVFITEATFGFPVYRWPDTAHVAADIIEWWDECRAQGRPAVLYCYALGKAQRLLAELAKLTDRRVLLHGALARLVQIYRDAGAAMLPTETVSEQTKAADFAGELILAPPSAGGSPWMRRFRNASTGFASGWMQVRGNRRRRGYDRGFVVSDHADWPGLLRTVEETGARRVLATHGNSEPLVQTLRERGIDAATLRTAFGGED
jgi:putative mRNA 3-end processing factor